MAFLSFLEISLDTANRFYAWGWKASLLGAAITLAGVTLLMWGTRVRDHDFETQIGQLALAAAKANERAAILELEAAKLRFQLDQEIQKHAPRRLSEEQKEALVAALRGKLREVLFVVQRDLETQAFALQLQSAFQE